MACVSAVVDVTDDCSTVSVQLFTVLVSVVALHRNDHINQSVLTHHCISVGSRLPCRPSISVQRSEWMDAIYGRKTFFMLCILVTF